MREISRHQRIVIDLALRILRSAMDRSAVRKVNSIEVRLALRCLLHHCPDRWPLEMFWDAAGVDNDIGRAQGCTAGFNGILRQLRLAGISFDQ
ncbi:hypothetical protein FPZ24_12070 [Sphingomonas panacisoli]|uniref:Uncharacterized protein n=1 Tax=Sphingomonas panacisoli TaxID=1813879 RepID=A0A5B8LN92_9SPHN|nr:hypothetical protein FPZ24_12070 [Sphingomonas panacisoli]